jgi:hypothetical protein
MDWSTSDLNEALAALSFRPDQGDIAYIQARQGEASSFERQNETGQSGFIHNLSPGLTNSSNRISSNSGCSYIMACVDVLDDEKASR